MITPVASKFYQKVFLFLTFLKYDISQNRFRGISRYVFIIDSELLNIVFELTIQ